MKISCLFAAALAAVNLLAAKPVATSVTARQWYPWNGKVDIVVTFSGASNDVAEAACVFAATNSATKAALAMAHVTDAGTISGSGATWTRRYVWDAAADLGEVKIADVVLAAEATPLGVVQGGVQLWEGGPYWAECNVGATKPEEYGYYFWWGDTVGYAREGGTWTSDYYYSGVTWVSSTGARMGSSPFSGSSCPTYNKTTAQLQSAGYIDATGNLVAKYDAATAHLGTPWRMPTDAEFAALIDNCTTTWTMRNGVYGRLVTGKGAFSTKSIFLPAAGYGGGSYLSYPGSLGSYWSSTPRSGSSYYAWYLNFNSDDFYRNDYYRHYGFPVRPLRGFAK